MAKILLKNVRLSYPDLFQPGTPMAGSTAPAKFGGQFIMAPESDAFKTCSAEMLRVGKEKFGPNAAAIIGELGKDKLCLRKGDSNLDKDGNVRNGYAGMRYITARNKTRPVVVDRDKTPLTEADGRPYGGCVVNCTVDIYAHDKPGLGKRIDATLLAVQFVGDGEAFGGSKGSVDDFDSLADSGEASAETADLF